MRALILIACVALGCSREPRAGTAGSPEVSISAPPPGASSASPPVPSSEPPAERSNVEDWILARLRSPGAPLKPLGAEAPDVGSKRLGAVGSAAFFVEEPTTLWLLVYRFVDQPKAIAARDAIVEALDRGPPYSVRTSITGAYLLAVGFGSHKPPSPEMERAQLAYLSAFAGEE